MVKAVPRNDDTPYEVVVQIRGNWCTAVVDSGAWKNFVSPGLVNKLQLPWKKKEVPYEVTNAEGYAFKYDDGQVSREIDHLPMYVKGYGRQDVSFDITEIGGDELILGRPWLRQFNPAFNWVTGQVECFRDPRGDDKRRSQHSYDDTDFENEYRHKDTTETLLPKGTKHKKEQGRDRRTRQVIATIR